MENDGDGASEKNKNQLKQNQKTARVFLLTILLAHWRRDGDREIQTDSFTEIKSAFSICIKFIIITTVANIDQWSLINGFDVAFHAANC